jgi:excisionase family DNA binding protein
VGTSLDPRASKMPGLTITVPKVKTAPTKTSEKPRLTRRKAGVRSGEEDGPLDQKQVGVRIGLAKGENVELFPTDDHTTSAASRSTEPRASGIGSGSMVETAPAKTMSVPEAGRQLGISRNAAYAAARRGELPVLRFGKKLRVPVCRLERLLEGSK